MDKRVVVLGGGVGGTMVANSLARSIPDEVRRGNVKITLLSNEEKHTYQPGFLFMALNEGRLEQFQRKEKTMLHPGVDLVLDNIVKIDRDGKRLIGEKGTVYPYDFLVISTGSFPDFDSVPGLAEGSYNFYTAEGAVKLREALANFRRGRILITIDVPHKCPAAPLEMTLMLDDYFRTRELRDQVDILYTYPIGRVHALQSIADWAQEEFESRDIKYETFFNLTEVNPQLKVATSLEGSEVQYDLLISVPAHKGAQVIRDSGFGDEQGFIPTDRHSLKMLGEDSIFVLGDATNLPISKAGSTAHYQADVVVQNLISELNGLPSTAMYDGKVFCFVESSMNQASYVEFNYTHPPQPAEPSKMLHWFKLAYNEVYWLSARGLL
ncbi:NAD(P)/FAD-dependent oxidoreductase [Effusibacillus lacus]|uniref:Pyridine nucleotide-disulfide oxidoreductase n=1 Tax=Effusibacillus lacus TaxID=1348429 RepID=A0A292YQQ8_9BACL|nr:FAD-dependent oxidoreductase [Effusibacillus lacus]TCS76910.1 sulfide:quinone oxidoreductase [Effusibacillus lacus]GAX91241.1 pyridine nucleotide-disulfide oxidoreductase [Effusibacillus lacus]